MELPSTPRLAVIGLGYVGLPLAVEFGKHWPTTGLDINAERIASLQQGRDSTGECSSDELAASPQLSLTDRKSTRLNSSHVARSYAVFCSITYKVDKPTAKLASTVTYMPIR